MLKYTHIDVRTVVEIPTFGEESFHIIKYEDSNPLHDDDSIRKFYSVYGKKDKIWRVIADVYDYASAKDIGRALADIHLGATLTEDNLVDIDRKEGEDDEKETDN